MGFEAKMNESKILFELSISPIYQRILDIEREPIPFGDLNARLFERSLAFGDQLRLAYQESERIAQIIKSFYDTEPTLRLTTDQ